MPDKTPMVVFFNNVFFFQEREKDLLKISFKRERKGLSVIGHARGPIARDLTMSFFPREGKDLLNTKSHRVDNVFPKRGKRLVISGGSPKVI